MRKSLGIGLTVLAAAVIWTFAGSSTQAFHSGGVAECGGCHSMHSPNQGLGNASKLLIKADPSSTCLSCHMSPGDTAPTRYHIATPNADMPAGTPPIQRSPGGDFGYLQKNYSWIPRTGAATEYSFGEQHGHNIVATDYGFVADGSATAPGGTFASSQLACTSCHDPHGKLRRLDTGSYATTGAPIIGSGSYDNSVVPGAGQAVGAYRLLRGPGSSPANATFSSIGIAVAPATYNQTEASAQVRVAYGSDSAGNTWGKWCATCHPDMHSTSGRIVHPVDRSLSLATATVYNTYVGSGNLGGAYANAFSSLTPFAEATSDFATLASHAKNDDSLLSGAGTSDMVTCLTCHRAHASGWNHALRWNNESDFMVYANLYPGTDNVALTSAAFAQGRTSAETKAAYYDRPTTKFATYQRVLCNKCHAKD